MEVITKKTIEKELHNLLNMDWKVTTEKCKYLVDEILYSMKHIIFENKKLKISTFGNFFVRNKKERYGRNMHLNEKTIINAREVVLFKNSNVLRCKINESNDNLVRNYSSQIVEFLTRKYDHKKKFANTAVQIFFNAITDGLAKGQRVEFRGFGSFSVRNYKSYTGRNPRTGAAVIVPEKKLIHFKYSRNIFSKI